MLFAFAGQDAWGYAGTWFNFRAKYTATGEGKVYGDFIKKENAVNKLHENVTIRHRHDSGGTKEGDTYTGNEPIDLHLFAEASDGWEFVEWRDNDGNKLSTSMPCDAQGNATSESTKYGYAIIENFKSKNVCGRDFSSSQGDASDHIAQHNGDYKDNYYTRVDAYYKAVFRKLENDPVVTAQPLDETLGLASFSPGDNQVGDIVTIATHPTGAKDKGYENKFIGWQHNGEFLRDDQGNIIRDNPYTFEVTENNGGVYYAVYESGYVFYRIKNFVTKDYFDAISDNVTGTGLAACVEALSNDFSMENDATFKAGSIYQIHTYKNTDSSGRLVYDLEVQNKHTKDYYDLPSIYIRLNQDVDKNTWNFSTSNDDGQGARLRVNEEGVQSVSAILDDRSLWYIEPMDKDLETAENYFSLDPNKLVEVDGKYYTTLRTSWNILIDPERTKPYVVTSFDESAGTFEMEPVTGNIIPAGTPVIIETKSNVVLENRMVPTLTNAASGAVPSGNLLQVSTKYFPNQDAPVANCKALMKNADGQLAFGGDALSTVNGNEAYLSVANEVILPTKIPDITLAALIASGDTEKTYHVTDLIGIDVVDHDGMLICKDNDGYAPRDVISENYIDFMHTAKGLTLTVPTNYDQSNWIGLRLPEAGGEFSALLLNRPLKGVVGKLIDAVNPEFQLTQMPEANGNTTTITLNPYIAASFYGANHQTGSNGKEYFFVQPKPMELAYVDMAQWDGTKFVTPVHDAAHSNWNTAELTGEFEFNGSYMLAEVNPEVGHVYKILPGVVKLKTDDYGDVYVLGTVNGLNWSTSKGVKMWTTDGNVYHTTLTVNNSGNGNGYFSFTKKLGATWDEINVNKYRFGADTQSMDNAQNYPVNSGNMGTPLPLRYDWNDGSRAFELAPGQYSLVVNMKEKTLVINYVTANASLRAENNTEKQYVVYPLSLAKVTTTQDGVITAVTDVSSKQVAGVKYYNVAGIESERPFEGVNIVVTRYSDGSTSTVKRLF